MKLLVTGASGFIGSHLAHAASRGGVEVRCLTRPSSDLSLLKDLRAPIVAGDVTDKESLRAAVIGVDAVVHCAATTSEASPDFSLSRRTNVLGTQNLIELCAQSNVERFIFISSLSATEQNTSAYGKTKYEAERIVVASALKYTILRPATVYGPGARGLFAKIGQYVARLPVIPVIGDGRQRFRPIHVDDLVTAILRCLASEHVAGKSYDLGGLDGVSFAQFIDGVGTALGRKPAKLRIPVAACVGLARALALVMKNPPLTIDNIVGLTQMSECDISQAQGDFDFSPMTFQAGIELLRRDGLCL